jgi:acetylcholinesterase
MKFPQFLALPCVHALSSVIIDTSSGLVHGTVDGTTPNVVQFLGIPYAEPPIGARRWLPALPKLRNDGRILNATRFGPSCPQYNNNKPTTWLTDAPEFEIEPLDYQSEDCLSVNIWAPWQNSTDCEEAAELPVIVWIHGGSFQTGGASTPYHNPSRWVERSGEHIVVAIKYVLMSNQSHG